MADTIVSDSSEMLERSRVGDQLWFWFASNGFGRGSALVLAPHDDSGKTLQKRLRRYRAAFGPPADGINIVGLLEISPRGHAVFRYTQPVDFSDHLIGYVSAHTAAAPPLRRLWGAQLVCPEGTYAPDWAAYLPDSYSPLTPGVLAAADALRSAVPGAVLSMAMVADTSATRIALMSPGADARSSLARLMRDTSGARWLHAALHVNEDGSFRIEGGPKMPNILKRLSRWVAQNCEQAPILARFRGCSLVRRGSDDALQAPALWEPVPTPAVSADFQVINHLQQALPAVTKKAAFWFTPRAANGAPALVIAELGQGRETVEAVVGGQPPLEPAVRGQVRKTGDILRFLVKEPDPDADRALQGFIQQHAASVPALYSIWGISTSDIARRAAQGA